MFLLWAYKIKFFSKFPKPYLLSQVLECAKHCVFQEHTPMSNMDQVYKLFYTWQKIAFVDYFSYFTRKRHILDVMSVSHLNTHPHLLNQMIQFH